MNATKKYSFLYFYPITLFLFCVDASLFYLFEKPFFYSLLAWYTLLLAQDTSPGRLAFALAALTLQSCLYTARVWPALLYLLPLTIIGLKARSSLYEVLWPYYMLFISCLLAQLWIIEHLILSLQVSFSYTYSIIIANIIMILILSLMK